MYVVRSLRVSVRMAWRIAFRERACVTEGRVNHAWRRLLLFVPYSCALAQTCMPPRTNNCCHRVSLPHLPQRQQLSRVRPCHAGLSSKPGMIRSMLSSVVGGLRTLASRHSQALLPAAELRLSDLHQAVHERIVDAKRVWIENPESGPKIQSEPHMDCLSFDRRIAVIFVWGTNQQSERRQSDLLSDSSPIQSGNPGPPKRSPYTDF